MKNFTILSALFLTFFSFQLSGQQLYWEENGATSTAGQLANIPKADATNLSTNFDDWFVFVGNIANQQITTNRGAAPALSVTGYPNSGTGNIFYTSTLNAAGNFQQNNIEYNRRIGNSAGSQTLYFSAVFSVFQVRTDDARFPFGFVEITNNDGDPATITNTWASRIIIDKLSGDQATGTFQVGVSKNGTDVAYPDLVADPAKEFNTGDVLVVIMKLTMDGIDNSNDQLDLYIGTSVPAEEPTTWDASLTTGVDAAVNGVFLREKMDGAKAVQDPFVDFGHIRVADSWSALMDEAQIDVTSITVSSENGNTITNFTPSQMSTEVLPADASINSVDWSITNGTGFAEIRPDGLLVPYKAGTVTVRADATDGSGVFDEQEITIETNTEVNLIYRQEAEYGNLLSGADVPSNSCTNVSGEGFVRYNQDANANTTHQYVTASEAGEYNMKLTYFSGATGSFAIDFSTNGTDYQQLDFAANGFCFNSDRGTAEFTINLAAGDNTLYFKRHASINPPLLDNISVFEIPATVESITVSAEGGVTTTTEFEPLQMSADVQPIESEQAVTWAVTNGTGTASITADGILVPYQAGTVTVEATSTDGTAISSNALEITITENTETDLIYRTEAEYGQLLGGADVVDVSCTKASGSGSVRYNQSTTANTLHEYINVPETGDYNLVLNYFSGNTVQIEFSTNGTDYSVLDFDNVGFCADVETAGVKTFTISLEAGTQSLYFRRIDGVPTPFLDLIEIYNAPDLVESIAVSAVGSVTTTTEFATLQMLADVLPAEAEQNINWSISNGTGTADITADGILVPYVAGAVTVTASASDGSGISDDLEITINENTEDGLIYRAEAEYGILNAGADVRDGDCTNVSGSGYVRLNQTETANIELQYLNILEAGAYTLRMKYFSGSNSSLEYSTNGTDYTVLEFENAGFCFESDGITKDFVVELAAGSQSLYFRKINGQTPPLLDRVEVSSNIKVQSIAVTSENEITSLNVGSTLQFSAEVLPATATDQSFTWSVVDGSGAASINSNGLLTAESIGTVTVQATANDGSGIIGSYELEITPILVQEITISSELGTDLEIGQTSQLTVSILPAEANDQSFTWSVEGDAGSVNENGLFTAEVEGLAVIKATANDGSAVQGVLEIVVGNPEILVSSVTVSSPVGNEIAIGESVQMAAAILPASSTDKTITWSVENGTGEATIDQNGLLSTVALGTITVTATANDASAVSGSLELTIVPEIILVSEINISGLDGTDLAIGETAQLEAEVLPADADDKSVTWSIENGTGQATIDQNGLLTAVSAGTVTAIATANDGSEITGILAFNINTVAVTEINVSSESGTTINLEATSQLTAQILPENATNKSVSWSIEGSAASIDANGLLTAGDAEGEVTVIATANDGSGVTGSLQITIRVPNVIVSEVIVSSTEGNEVLIGEQLTLNAEVLPEDASIKTVTWSVQNGAGEATIDQSGILTAIAEGNVTVVATSDDQAGIIGQLEIIIYKELVSEIIISSAEGNSLEIGQTSQMSAEVSPVSATDKSVVWSVENGTGTAEIDSEGLLTAVAEGMITVIATASDESAVTAQLALEILPEAILSNNREKVSSITIYPNPVKYTFKLSAGNVRLSSVEIIDLTGSVVLKVDEVNNAIDVSQLENAVYVVKAVSESGEIYLSRIIKN